MATINTEHNKEAVLIMRAVAETFDRDLRKKLNEVAKGVIDDVVKEMALSLKPKIEAIVDNGAYNLIINVTMEKTDGPRR